MMIELIFLQSANADLSRERSQLQEQLQAVQRQQSVIEVELAGMQVDNSQARPILLVL
jgi:hypothetical protein